MMASWASVTDQSNTDCSSHRSSAASDSDASFLTEADFASAVAKAAELSGLTVVGTTVCDPKTGKPGLYLTTVTSLVIFVQLQTICDRIILWCSRRHQRFSLYTSMKYDNFLYHILDTYQLLDIISFIVA